MIAACTLLADKAGFLQKPVPTMRQLAARAAQTAVRALLREAEAGPKPGLVDRFGPGVHTDMDIRHFRLSATALGPFFEAITLESAIFMATMPQNGYGRFDLRPASTATSQYADTRDAPTALAVTLRNLGVQAESAMLSATGGINTHKGAIWTLGLLCAAVGSLAGYGSSKAAGILPASLPRCLDTESSYLNAGIVCAHAAQLAQAILSFGVDPDSITNSGRNAITPQNMHTLPAPGMTKGLVARQAYGLRSARDEALAGFPSIQFRALPLARKLRNSRLPEDEKVISVLLAVMCEADDTCLVARGGLPALQAAKSTARQVLDRGGPGSGEGGILYRKMVADFKDQGLSPGGSADLCAATLFLAELEAGLAICC